MERIRNTVKADEGDGGMTLGEKTDTRTHDVPSTSRATLGMTGAGGEVASAHRNPAG